MSAAANIQQCPLRNGLARHCPYSDVDGPARSPKCVPTVLSGLHSAWMIADPLHERPLLVRPRPGKVHCHAVDGHFYPGATSTDDTMAVGYASCTDAALPGMSAFETLPPRSRSTGQASSRFRHDRLLCPHDTASVGEKIAKGFRAGTRQRQETKAVDHCTPFIALRDDV